MRKMPKRSCRAFSLFTIKAQSSTRDFHLDMCMKVCGGMHQIISFQTGLLHDSDVRACLLQCSEFIMVMWKTNSKMFGNFGDITMKVNPL